jgi:hypothetical protein
MGCSAVLRFWLATELADLKRRQNDPAQQAVGIDLIAGPFGKDRPCFRFPEACDGPTHDVPPEMSAQSSLPKGRVIEFTMSSAQSKSIPSLRATPTLSERWIRLTPRSSW